MPICQNCGREWTWKQTIQRLFRLKCPYCREKQYESASSRMKTGGMSLIPLVVLPVAAGFDAQVWVTAILIAVIEVLFIFGVYPFLMQLSNEQEPYW
ncbi:TIGR04104 family putative zinc finger protein [Lentibacillus sediminis]|uniref:TIGR04104 family putative zinc finger protein n=1 Tax=Lentibacillus sediminis TaxID=1940529 RepID=UPI000C1C026C|nr:TIGR04104 family putative zinc finger protein [Lentibacillus sediminis]